MKKHLFFNLIFLVFPMLLSAQPRPLALGEWRVHLPYQNCNSIVETPDRIYSASEFGLFCLVKDGASLERLSKINGFSQTEANALEYDPVTENLWISYKNSMIDVVNKGKIYNLADLFRKSIIGDKSIFHIYLKDRKAYISTALGIIVYDQDKKEVIDNYFELGQSDTNSVIPIYSTAIVGDTLFAAAGHKIMYGLIKPGINLADYTNWKVLSSSSRSKFVAEHQGVLYAEMDSVPKFWNGNSWQSLYTDYSSRINAFKNSNGYLVISGESITSIVRPDFTIHTMVKNGNNMGIIDTRGQFWHVNSLYGLIEMRKDSSEIFYAPNGPNTVTSYKMINYDNAFWVSAGGFNGDYVYTYNYSGTNIFEENQWKSNAFANTLWQGFHDVTSMAVSPTSKQLFLGSHGKGVMQVVNRTPINRFNHQNSTLDYLFTGDTITFSTGLAFDAKDYLWVSNYGRDSALHVRSPQGEWKAFRLPTIHTGEIVIDKNNFKWMITPNANFSNSGLCVYDDRSTPMSEQDDRARVLTTQNAGLPTNAVRSILASQNGEIWVGTDAGLVVFNNPGNAFGDRSTEPIEARRIIIEQEGYAGYLLGEEIIYCLAEDGAGRKWVGTNKGAWLISRSGLQIIRNFNVDNSPLPSNNVLSIGIDEQSGEVFFGTDKGLISFRGDATAPKESLQELKIFPNPVREDYYGEISIEGLTLDARVKITDITGAIVYETISNGGRAVWDGKKFNGQRPATGVYLVFAINSDGTESTMGKLLIISK